MKFRHRLALALGRTVAEMERSVSFREFRQWVAYYNAEPWGTERLETMGAHIAAEVANVPFVMFGKGNRRPFKAADFLPKSPAPEQSQQDMAGVLFAAAQAAKYAKELRERKRAPGNS